MRYRYWTVQARPTPTSISLIGIGVIVEDPSTGELAHQFVERPKQLLSRYPEAGNAARIIRDLNRWLGSASEIQTSLELDGRFVASGQLDTMVHRWNNLITINHKQYISADSIQAAVEFLFDKLIAHGGSSNKTQRVADVRQRVQNVYKSKEPLRELIVTRPELTIDNDLGERFDLGVIRENKIFELNDAFSMQSSDLRQTEHRIQAWTWKMSVLRSSGASLDLPDGNTVEVDNRTPIVATFWPPTDASEGKLLSTMSRQWDKLEIDYIEISEIESHAEKLSLRAA